MAFKMTVFKLRVPDQRRMGWRVNTLHWGGGNFHSEPRRTRCAVGGAGLGVGFSGSGGERGVLMWGFSEPV